MSSNIYRFVWSNVLTVFYSFLALLMFAVEYLKNPFRSPWAQKLRLVPPKPLSDPIYGVHKYIKVNDIKIHYVESGDPTKPLMIFLHGFPEFWYSWRHQIVEFSKDYWCVAVDMRGYGDSERPEGVEHYKIELLVEDVRGLLRHLGAQKCILVSHDWGGLVAARFRDVYPDLLNACIMLASASRESWVQEIWNNSSQRLKSWYIFLFRAPYIPEQFMLMSDQVMYDKSMLVKGKDGTNEQDIECYKYWFGKPSAFTPPINYYRANFAYSYPEKFHKEEIPLLVAHGQNDAYINKSILDIMKKEYATIETMVVEDVGHFMQQEDPGKVNKVIRDFLAKNNL